MSVIRGDAARRLIAQTRTTHRQQPPAPREPAWSATLSIPWEHGVTEAAGTFVADELARHDLTDRIDDATLVIHELVTNARVNSRGTIIVTVRLSAEGLIVEVFDDGAVRPRLKDATRLGSVTGPGTVQRGHPARPGAGLKIVSLLSRNWGINEQEAGKTVWALLHEHDPGCLEQNGGRPL